MTVSSTQLFLKGASGQDREEQGKECQREQIIQQ